MGRSVTVADVVIPYEIHLPWFYFIPYEIHLGFTTVYSNDVVFSADRLQLYKHSLSFNTILNEKQTTL